MLLVVTLNPYSPERPGSSHWRNLENLISILNSSLCDCLKVWCQSLSVYESIRLITLLAWSTCKPYFPFSSDNFGPRLSLCPALLVRSGIEVRGKEGRSSFRFLALVSSESTSFSFSFRTALFTDSVPSPYRCSKIESLRRSLGIWGGSVVFEWQRRSLTATFPTSPFIEQESAVQVALSLLSKEEVVLNRLESTEWARRGIGSLSLPRRLELLLAQGRRVGQPAGDSHDNGDFNHAISESAVIGCSF